MNSGGSEFLQLRIFPNDKRIRFEGRVHEIHLEMYGYEHRML